MSAGFHSIVAQYLQILSDCLAQGIERNEEPDDFGVVSAPPSPEFAVELQRQTEPGAPTKPDLASPLLAENGPAPNQLKLPFAEATLLDGGSMIFPIEDGAGPLRWCLFRRSTGATGMPVFHPTGLGSIDGASSIEEFVRHAYRYVLRREPDDEGFRNYTLSLRKNEIFRHDLLAILASSPEAQNSGYEMLIIPCPSRWLQEEVLLVDGSVAVDEITLSY